MKIPLPIHQLINNISLVNLKNALLKTISESKSQIKATDQLKTLNEKFSNANKWYIKLTKLEQVYLAQDRVTDLQGKLLEVQEKRREVSRQLNDVRARSIELQDQIHKVKRQEDLEKFLDLMKAETEILKLEKSITKQFQEYDRTERELFTAFTDSIRDSHEKQRAQMEYTKYFGLVLSIVSSFLAFIYSTLRKEQLIRIIDGKLMGLNVLEDRSSLNELKESNAKLVTQIENNIKVINQLKDTVISSHNNNNDNSSTNSMAVDNLEPVLDENEVSQSQKYLKYVGVAFGIWFIAKILSS